MTPDDLKNFRAQHKISRLKLAESIGVSDKSIEAWEYGTNPIPKWLGLALAAYAFINSHYPADYSVKI